MLGTGEDEEGLDWLRGEKEYAHEGAFGQRCERSVHLLRNLLDGMAYPEDQSPMSQQIHPEDKGGGK